MLTNYIKQNKREHAKQIKFDNNNEDPNANTAITNTNGWNTTSQLRRF